MEIRKAIEKAKKNKKIRNILNNDGFFCSGFVTIEKGEKINKWNLNFYNPSDKKITSIVVGEKVELGTTDKPLHENVTMPDEKKIKIKGEEALEKAKKEFKKMGKPLAKILISFQKKDEEVWSISFITKVGSIVNMRLSPENGKIIETEEVNLFEKYKAK